jgi:M6 family metalloprotease-like protein
MDRFEAWFDGQDAFAPAAATPRPRIALPSPGRGLLRITAILGALLLATSLVGGAHRIGMITTSGTVGTTDPGTDSSVDAGGGVTPSPTPDISTPPQPAVNGVLPIDQCKITTNNSDIYLSAGFPMSRYRDVESMGVIKIAVIYVQFPDAEPSESLSALHQRIESHVSGIYSEMSFGALSIDLVSSSEWIMMDKTSNEYNLLQSEAKYPSVVKFVTEAVRKADPGIDFTGIDAVAIFSTELADGIAGDFQWTLQERIPTGEGLGVISTVVTGGEWWRVDSDPMALAHELGHVLGLQDLYYGESDDTFEDAHKFVGDFDLMGTGVSQSAAPTIFGWDRWRLGWIEDSQVICASPSEGTEVNISALQSGTGVILLVIPLSPTRVVVVESRRAVGWDQNLIESGALVYLVDVNIDTTEGPIKILADGFGDGFDSAPLSAGEYVDALSYTITSLEAAAWGDRIYITP